MVTMTLVSKLACFGLLLVLCIPLVPNASGAPADWVPDWQPTPQGEWWIPQPESEVTSPYYNSIPYWQIAPTLHEIELSSDRVDVEVMGQSAEGRNLFLVTVAKPDVLNNLGHYRTLRHFMVEDPERAQEMLDQFKDFKVPFYVHAGIHGNEYTGVDASLELIKTLAYSNDPEVLQILDNVIFLVNPVANPDGRVHGTYWNGNGHHLNMDYVTLSQPEVRADVRVIRDWMPLVALDLHQYYSSMLIEPCTPPHNPNTEYDLYIKWALAQAEAMVTSVYENTGFPSTIPFRDWQSGFDDYGPVYMPGYSMYHGAYGHTLEAPDNGLPGVQAHYWAVRGALDFVVTNRMGMIYDQMEIMKRGVLGLPQQPIPQEILNETKYKQYQSYVEFPEAYVIPAGKPLQANPIDAAYLVDFLIFHGIEVEKAKASFKIAGSSYPAGTYVVRMQQGLRGLANVLLSDGWDVSYSYSGHWVFPVEPAWNNPLVWGVNRAVVWDAINVQTVSISHADVVQGAVVSGGNAGYAFLPTSNEAIRATNDLLQRGIPLLWTTATFKDLGTIYGVGTFVIPGTVPGASAYASEIASRYKITVHALSKLPTTTQNLRMPRIAVDADFDLRFVLKDLGFTYDQVEWTELNSGLDLSAYNVYVVSAWSDWYSMDLTSLGKATLQGYVNRGGNYVGIGSGGIDLAIQAGLADVSYKAGYWYDKGIVRVMYASGDLVAAQYPADSFAFVGGPVWFTRYGNDMKVTASLPVDDFFVAGYWPHRDIAGGHPLILWKTSGNSNVVLMGIDPAFDMFPMLTFRLVANSLYLN
jgi:hypothetical protein